MASYAFVGFWIVVTAVLAFVALRGGPRGARNALQSQSPAGRRAAFAAFIVVFVGMGIVLPAALLAGNNHNDSKQALGVKLVPADRNGRELFGQICGVCHTLAAAKQIGKQGPNLDNLIGNIPEAQKRPFILSAIDQGRQRGNGTMPAKLVQGRDAQDVADFVARVAGK